MYEQPLVAPQSSAPKVEPGGFWRRLVAAIFDNAVVAGVQFPLTILLGANTNPLSGWSGTQLPKFSPEELRATLIRFALGAVIYFTYCATFYRYKSATPGKILVGLKVVDMKTGERLGLGQTFLREIIGKWLSALALGIGYLMVPFRKDKRALHDFIADTQVRSNKE